jgi:hypothetical protein
MISARRRLLRGLTVVAAVAVSVTGSPVAHADNDKYLLCTEGVGDPSTLVSLGEEAYSATGGDKHQIIPEGYALMHKYGLSENAAFKITGCALTFPPP